MRQPLPLVAEDISAFARSLAGQIAAHEGVPSHLALLNMLARSSGYRNFQHLRAQREALARLAAPQANIAAAPPASIDAGRLRRLVRLFDAEGRLVRWPSKRGQEASCLWVVWTRVPARRVMSEPELNVELERAHTFGDAALLRRGLCDMGLMTRTPDGREYRRVEAKPGPEALLLLSTLRSRAA